MQVQILSIPRTVSRETTTERRSAMKDDEGKKTVKGTGDTPVGKHLSTEPGEQTARQTEGYVPRHEKGNMNPGGGYLD
jgi:hypothetical protein